MKLNEHKWDVVCVCRSSIHIEWWMRHNHVLESVEMTSQWFRLYFNREKRKKYSSILSGCRNLKLIDCIWFSQILSDYSSCSRISIRFVQRCRPKMPTFQLKQKQNLFNVSESTPKTTRMEIIFALRRARHGRLCALLQRVEYYTDCIKRRVFSFLCFVIVRITEKMKIEKNREARDIFVVRTIAAAMFRTNFKNSIRHPARSARMFVYRRQWCVLSYSSVWQPFVHKQIIPLFDGAKAMPLHPTIFPIGPGVCHCRRWK